MTALDLAAIRARADAATEGPWEIVERYPDEDGFGEWRRINSWSDTSHEAAICEVGDINHDGEADATFIAHARTDIPALLAEVRRLQGFLAIGAAENMRRYISRLEALLTDEQVDEASGGAARQIGPRTCAGSYALFNTLEWSTGGEYRCSACGHYKVSGCDQEGRPCEEKARP